MTEEVGLKNRPKEDERVGRRLVMQLFPVGRVVHLREASTPKTIKVRWEA